jgi:hypothetical protein
VLFAFLRVRKPSFFSFVTMSCIAPAIRSAYLNVCAELTHLCVVGLNRSPSYCWHVIWHDTSADMLRSSYGVCDQRPHLSSGRRHRFHGAMIGDMFRWASIW